MNQTDSSSPSDRRPTPAPSLNPTSPDSNELSYEVENELDALLESNRLLDAESQSLAAQVFSLQALLAERGLAEIADMDWLDLLSVHRVIYVPGTYTKHLPSLKDHKPIVSLSWTPGYLKLCAGMKPTEDDASLPIPNIRDRLEWPVQSPPQDLIPPEPTPLPTTARSSDSQTIAYEQMVKERKEKWTVYCQPLLRMAEQAEARSLSSTMADERQLAYMAVRAIQDRRRDPETEPGYTIAAELETLAGQMRAAAAA